jgi:hypothetical protein
MLLYLFCGASKLSASLEEQLLEQDEQFPEQPCGFCSVILKLPFILNIKYIINLLFKNAS